MEDEEEADVPEMVPQLGWHMPPLLGAQYQPPSTWAAGEESQEKRDRLGASQQDHQRPGEFPKKPCYHLTFFYIPSTLCSLSWNIEGQSSGRAGVELQNFKIQIPKNPKIFRISTTPDHCQPKWVWKGPGGAPTKLFAVD